MYLHTLEIKNYRSLEHVELNNLGNFNVLIGRNNSGKSSVFGALAVLNNVINGISVDWESVLTARDMTRALELRLLFKPRPQDRDQFINLLSHQLDENRRAEMRLSPFLRMVEFVFRDEPRSRPLEVRHVKLLAEDGRWAAIMTMNPETHPRISATDIQKVAENNTGPLEYTMLHVDQTNIHSKIDLEYKFMVNMSAQPTEPLKWLLWRLGRYLNQSFFFNPFRHSEARLPAKQTGSLEQNGSNLAQVLHTISSNDRRGFSRIEEFLHAALPDIGVLQTPIIDTSTEVSFHAPYGNYAVRLHDMGGGIEQLLMVATVLLTTDDESTIFLEEPESHLHAGAQRFLNEKLFAGNRQVFISTHSPTFINSPGQKSMYQVKIENGRTNITHLNNADSLSKALEDIGSRNSDVLLSDAVLFVEGPGDQRVFEIWSKKLGTSLEEHNITIVPMGGGQEATRGARARSEVLEGISQKAPVPHMFVLDRDERSKAEVIRLEGALNQHVHLLQRRELENYLLVPRALLAALRSKHNDNATIIEKIDKASETQVNALIKKKAAALKGLVLVKRIRAELAGLKGGLLPRDSIAGLAAQIGDKNFSQIIHNEIESRLHKHLAALDINNIVRTERDLLDKDWSVRDNHLCLALGEEIVSAVFNHFGSEYRKPNDTVRIAQEMKSSDIAEEIRALIKRIVDLAGNPEASEERVA